MPQVYLRKEAYDRIIESGHAKDLEAFLVHAVDLAIEEVRQIPKSDPSPELPGSLSFTSIPTPAPTVTSDNATIDKPKPARKKVAKPKPKPEPSYQMVRSGFHKVLQCDWCSERFENLQAFQRHACF